MKAKKLLAVSMLVISMGLIGGCHYGLVDGYDDYGGYGSYRDGFRDGRDYERRRDQLRHRRDRFDSRWNRW